MADCLNPDLPDPLARQMLRAADRRVGLIKTVETELALDHLLLEWGEGVDGPPNVFSVVLGGRPQLPSILGPVASASGAEESESTRVDSRIN